MLNIIDQILSNKNEKIREVSFQDKNLTYRELNERSNQLAVYLREKGVKKENIVGVMVTHSFEMIAGILGSMKAGAAYLPIDSSYPIERINYILQYPLILRLHL